MRRDGAYVLEERVRVIDASLPLARTALVVRKPGCWIWRQGAGSWAGCLSVGHVRAGPPGI